MNRKPTPYTILMKHEEDKIPNAIKNAAFRVTYPLQMSNLECIREASATKHSNHDTTAGKLMNHGKNGSDLFSKNAPYF